MLAILVNTTNPRLLYILDWIFNKQLGVDYTLTTDIDAWQHTNGAKINYSKYSIPNCPLHILPSGILDETSITPKAVQYNRWKHTSILFYNQPGKLIPFDLFGAAFYLISRYEEYLPFKSDKHGRFPSALSVAKQFNFLQQPVVDLWIMHLGKILTETFGVEIKHGTYAFQPTYDIDIAYCYTEQSLFRNIAAGIKDAFTGKWSSLALRYEVCKGQRTDPYDNFSWMQALHSEKSLQPIYFWLVAENKSSFDQNNDRTGEKMQHLLLHQEANSAKHGIHPSYKANKDARTLAEELQFLQSIKGSIDKSRQHYIQLSFPHTYRQLIAAGLLHDYTMGYPDANGFRAGTCKSFYWFDLINNTPTTLLLHPFVFMDATAIFYNRHTPEEALLEFEQLFWEVHRVKGTLISIFHNYTLGENSMYKGWRQMYEQAVNLATQQFSPKIVL